MSTAQPWILGLSNNMHNGAACLLHGSDVVVAVQEERLNRIKRSRLDYRRSCLAVDYCLNAAGISPRDVDLIVECKTLSDSRRAYLGSPLHERFGSTRFVEVSHHLGHAASVAYTSGFQESTVLVVDGGGSLATELSSAERVAVRGWHDDGFEHLSLYHFKDGTLTPVEKYLGEMSYLRNIRYQEMPKFASLGHMFSSVAYVSFHDYMEAGKVMGLAPYGRIVFPTEEWFRYDQGTLTFLDDVPNKWGSHPGWPHAQEELANLAASVQAALEDALAHVMGRIHDLGLPGRLAYAGGVALNSVANHRVVAKRSSDLFILPAAEDSGTALGAAFYGLSLLEPSTKRLRRLEHDSLGCRSTSEQIDTALRELPHIEEIVAGNVLESAALLLTQGSILGWYEGGAEFGPRALGHRSILCDARRLDAKDVLNARVKHRESFRPFAPVVLEEFVHDWFDVAAVTSAMQFMLEVCPFQPHVEFASVVHVDRTGRLQVIGRHTTTLLRDLLVQFHKVTGVPLLVNTSFNIAGEPIVETPWDALWAMLFTGIDYVVIEGRLFTKSKTYRSPLDLILERAAELETGDGVIQLCCSTPHGEHVYSLNSEDDAAKFYRVIDGQTAVSELARRAFGADADDKRAMRCLGVLMRARAARIRVGRG